MQNRTKKIALSLGILLLFVVGVFVALIQQKNESSVKMPQGTGSIHMASGSLSHTDSGTASHSLMYYLVLPHDDMSGDIRRYLTGVVLGQPDYDSLDTLQRIRESLQALFLLNEEKISGTDLQNMLEPSNLYVRSITVDTTGVYHIDLQGKIVGLGVMADPFIKLQITRTIEQYTNNYSLTLNGSEPQWRCALDMSGLCE